MVWSTHESSAQGGKVYVSRFPAGMLQCGYIAWPDKRVDAKSLCQAYKGSFQCESQFFEALPCKVAELAWLSLQAARSPIFAGVTGAMLMLTTLLSLARIVAIQTNFRAPMTLMLHFQYSELPALAIYNYPHHYPTLNLTNFQHSPEQIDVSILEQKNLTLCYGPEWYRFPSSFLVPDVVRTEFIKTDLGIQLPKHFVERRSEVPESRQSLKKRLEIARTSPIGYNDQNIEEMDRYVSEDDCSYIIDLDFPDRRKATGQIPLFDPKTWERVLCEDYLDSERSPISTRTFSFPTFSAMNSYGDFCLLRNKKLQIRANNE